MKRVSILSYCVLLCFTSFSFSQMEDQALKVYVTARNVEAMDKQTRKQTEKELKQNASKAKEEKKNAEKQLKSQFGGDKKKWPAEKQEEFKHVEDRERMILMELETLKVVQKDLDDTVADIKRSIQGDGLAKVKKYINLVETPEEADLSAVVIGRRREGIPGLFACVDCWYYVYLKITSEAGIVPETLGTVSPKSASFEGVRRIHQYRDEEPFWIIEASSLGRWGHAANQAAGAINNFIEENRLTLKSK